jgi:hypothetical protein
MKAAPLTPVVNLSRLNAAAHRLNDAQVTFLGASLAVGDARKVLENARAELLCKGVEGNNAEQREAKIRLELQDLIQDLHQAEAELSEARCELECARLEWEVARYSVKAMEVAA